MLTLEEMRELEREACRKDPVYFCETYCHIEDKDADELIQPFTLWDGQKKALVVFAENRLVCVLKARQLGFTWLALAEVARLVALNTGRTAIGLSRSEDEDTAVHAGAYTRGGHAGRQRCGLDRAGILQKHNAGGCDVAGRPGESV